MKTLHGLLTFVLVGWALTPVAMVGQASPDVFALKNRPAPLEARIVPAKPGEPLRVLTVEERVGLARSKELVRVPVFFHEGESTDVQGLAIFAADDMKRRQPIPYQADDVRYDQAGNLSRMHLYFLVDLEPWQRKRYYLVTGKNPGTDLPAVALEKKGGELTLRGEDLQVTFQVEGPKAGTITRLVSSAGPVAIADGFLAPRLSLVRQTHDLKVIRTTPMSYHQPESLQVRSVRWGSGPHFAKLVVVAGPPQTPDRVELTYLIPRHGNVMIQTEKLYPAEANPSQTVGAAAKDHVLLAGKLVLGKDAADHKLVPVPAGLRKLTRSVHPYVNTALVNEKAGVSLFPIPLVQNGGGSVRIEEDGEVVVPGAGSFRRNPGSNSDTLRTFFGEVRFVFSKAVTEESLWEMSRQHFQPLVAIVDEPGLTVEHFREVMPRIAGRFFEIKFWGRGWKQTACMHWLKREPEMFKKLLATNPTDKEIAPDYWLPAWARDGQAPPADKKDIGRLDPYHLSFGVSGVVPLALYLAPSERMDQLSYNIAQASRRVNARTQKEGFPYINCFATAFNMQIGTYHLGIYGGKKTGDLDLVQFCRDGARTPATLDIFGHGQRTYPGNRVTGQDSTDLLYEDICDYHLRAIEVFCQEDLWLHPAAFGRYFDCVDVNADIYQATPEWSKRRAWHRANLFRAQAHDHRWEAWDVSPYMGIFRHADDAGTVGITEANYYLRWVSGAPINWSELMWFFHADLMLAEGLKAYRPEPGPVLPEGLQVKRQGEDNLLTWKAVPGVVGYRIYRADKMGGPWIFVNSPYTDEPAGLIAATTYLDRGAGAGQVYFVTAMDAQRRESRWFPQEPMPRPGKGK